MHAALLILLHLSTHPSEEKNRSAVNGSILQILYTYPCHLYEGLLYCLIKECSLIFDSHFCSVKFSAVVCASPTKTILLLIKQDSPNNFSLEMVVDCINPVCFHFEKFSHKNQIFFKLS